MEGGCKVQLHLQRVHRHERRQVQGWRHGDTRAPRTLEGEVEPGSVPSARRLGPGSSAYKTKCSSIPSPSPGASACPMARGPDSSSPEEREPHSVLISGVSAINRRVRTLGWGPKVVVKWWVSRALAALPARCL